LEEALGVNLFYFTSITENGRIQICKSHILLEWNPSLHHQFPSFIHFLLMMEIDDVMMDSIQVRYVI